MAGRSPVADRPTGNSVGIVETIGTVALVEAMDAMVKAAHVEVTKYERAGAGRVAACIRGDIAAVRVAVEAGVAAASPLGEASSVVLANPHSEVVRLIG